MAFTNQDRERAVRTETKVDDLIEARKDHEGRLRKVESSHLKMLGGGAVVSALMGYATAWFRS